MNEEHLMNIILSPVISEKSTIIADMNRQFVFKVRKDATKPAIKRAIEKLFDVEVSSVQVSNVKSKLKRHGRTLGRRKGWKKAFVCLKEGFDINFADAK